jgi:chromosome segregation ATPase
MAIDEMQRQRALKETPLRVVTEKADGLLEQNNELKQTLSLKDIEIESQCVKICELERRLAELKEHNCHATQETAKKMVQWTREFGRRLIEFETQVQVKNTELGFLVERCILTAQGRCDGLQTRHNEEVALMNAKLNEAKTQISSLEEKLTMAEKQNAQLVKDLSAQLAEHKARTDETEEKLQEGQQLEAVQSMEIADLEMFMGEKAGDLQSQLLQLSRKCQLKDAEIRKLSNCNEEHEKRVSVLQTVNKAAVSELANITEKMMGFCADREAAERQWNAERSALELDASKLRDSLSEKELLVAELKSVFDGIQSSAASEIERLNNLLGSKNRQIELMQVKFDTVIKSVDEIQHQGRMYVEELANRDLEIRRLRQEHSHLYTKEIDSDSE